jgi:hypothetical protein
MLQERRARRIRFGPCIHSRQPEWAWPRSGRFSRGRRGSRASLRQGHFLPAAQRRMGS